MTVPKLRFKEFDGDWSASNLGKATEYFKGFAFKSESYKEDGIRIIRVSDLDKDSIKYQNEAIFLDSIDAQNYQNWAVKKKDIIVTTVGSKPHLVASAVGRPIFIKKNDEGLLNQNLLVLRPKNEHMDSYFIFSQLLDKKYLTHIETIQRGNANQSNITVKDLQEFELFQTSKAEQTKIASFLSTVDEKISQLNQKHRLLCEYKQGMMQKLFSQQLCFKADDGSEFGEWEETKFLDLMVDLWDYRGKTPKKLGMDWGDGEIQSLSALNIKKGFIDFDADCHLGSEKLYKTWMNKGDLEKGDIIFTEPYRVCRRVNILRDYPDDKIKIYP